MKTIEDALKELDPEWCPHTPFENHLVLECLASFAEDGEHYEAGRLYSGSKGFDRDLFRVVCTREEFEQAKDAANPWHLENQLKAIRAKAEQKWVPEVGRECKSRLCGEEFSIGCVTYRSDQIEVWKSKVSNNEYATRPGDREFRPIKTEREKMEDAFEGINLTGHRSEIIDAVISSGKFTLKDE